MSDDLHPLVEAADEASARPAPPQVILSPEAAEKSPGFGEALKGLKASGPAYWLVNLVNFSDGIAYFGILNLLVLYFSKDLHIADQYASMYVSVLTGPVALLMVPGGWISDRVGTRNAISLSLLLGALGRGGLWACTHLSPNMVPFGVITSLLTMALATGILQPALYAGVKETTPTRYASMGFSLLYAIMNLGIVAESAISPFIRTDSGLGWGIRGVLAVMVAITVLQLVIHLLAFPKLSTTQTASDSQDGIGIGGTPEAPAPKGTIFNLRFFYFIFILLPVRTLFAHQWLTVPDYIFRCFDQSVADRYEWFTGLNPLVVMVAVPLFCHLTSRVHVLRMMIIGTAVSAAATFLLSLPPDPTRLIAYVIVFSLGEALWASRFLEYIAALAPPGQVGLYMGVANLPWFLAKFTTGFYSGWMLTHYLPKSGQLNPEALWTLYGLIACVSPVGLLIAYPWLRAGDKENAGEP
ncbi:MFS transporter [bacterium]|nr:MFS transporter [bacterium]